MKYVYRLLLLFVLVFALIGCSKEVKLPDELDVTITGHHTVQLIEAGAWSRKYYIIVTDNDLLSDEFEWHIEVSLYFIGSLEVQYPLDSKVRINTKDLIKIKKDP